MTDRLRTAFLTALLLVLLPATALAVGQGRLQGDIVDANGYPMANVEIHVTNDEIGYEKTIKAKKNGRFTLLVVDGTRTYTMEFRPAEGRSWTEQVKIDTSKVDKRTFSPPSAAGPSASEIAATQGANKAIDAFNAGVALVQQGDASAAKAKFTEAKDINPKMPQPYSVLAGIYLDEKDYPQAIAMAEVLLELEPDNPRALQVLYDAHAANGDQAKAEEYLNQLTADGGTDAAIRVFNIGAEAARVGDLDGALESFERAAELDPELVASHAALARVYFDREDWANVVTAAETALDLDPDQPEIQKLRYEAYRRSGNEEKAMEVFAEMAESDPEGLATTLYEQGRELFNAGNTAAAKAAFEQALEADANYARAHYMLGLCYVNVGDSAKAKQHLEKFVELAPDDPEAGTAKDMIQYMG